MGQHIQKQPSKQPRLEIFSTMSIQYFALLIVAVSVLGKPLGRSNDGRKHLDARSAMRHAQSEGEEGVAGVLVKAVEEMVEKIDKLANRMSNMSTEISGVKTEISGVKTEVQKVLPSRFVRLSYGAGGSVGLNTAGQLDESSGSGGSGRVEVYHEGEWGTVCDDHIEVGTAKGINAANVVCKQLGYSSGVPIATPKGQRGAGTIWMEYPVCSGEEASLLDCEFKWSYEFNNCHHQEDFSVQCS